MYFFYGVDCAPVPQGSWPCVCLFKSVGEFGQSLWALSHTVGAGQIWSFTSSRTEIVQNAFLNSLFFFSFFPFLRVCTVSAPAYELYSWAYDGAKLTDIIQEEVKSYIYVVWNMNACKMKLPASCCQRTVSAQCLKNPWKRQFLKRGDAFFYSKCAYYKEKKLTCQTSCFSFSSRVPRSLWGLKSVIAHYNPVVLTRYFKCLFNITSFQHFNI